VNAIIKPELGLQSFRRATRGATSVLGSDGGAARGEGRLRTAHTKDSSLHKLVRWNHLPHSPLSLEIANRVAHREPADAEREVEQEYFRGRLGLLELEEHDAYINRVAAELKRELRICRDVYREYLQTLNNKSITAKARAALDFAVAPMASRRLREEVITYVRQVGVSEIMFGTLFHRLADRMLTHPNFDPEWMTFEKTTFGLIPDTCFQELKKATPREIESLATGPFGNPTQPFELLIIGLDGTGAQWKPNAIWDNKNILLGCELWRLWDFVFHEICDQHSAIDREEHSNVARALIALDPFERLAGKMFYEATDGNSNRIPDEVFVTMGRQLDRDHMPLANNLDPKGREILSHLARRGKSITTWETALADRREQKFLPVTASTRGEATTLKQFGTLSRTAKRAFYRAKDAYVQALERVYEQRAQAPIKKNPFSPTA
jgi:hypothetical protein